jgi:3-oxoacyl-[acyl-carrier-protein] synthase-3
MTGTKYKTVLAGVHTYLPPRVVKNDELTEYMDTNDAWIQERTGIKERRFVDPNVSTSDLGVASALSLLQEKNLKPTDIDAVIAATLSPDYYFPGIAPIIQRKLGLAHVPAYDIRLQCSAFVYATQMADAFIRANMYKRILVVFTDVQSKILDFSTRGRNVSVLFGDGAASVLYESSECSDHPSSSNTESGIIDTLLGSNGEGADLLLMKYPGTATPQFLAPQHIEQGETSPQMEGRIVFKHAVTHMVDSALKILQKNNISSEQIKLCIPHQANFRISEAVRERLNLPEEKVFNNIFFYGNTTSATIPICIKEAWDQKKISKGDIILTVAFGAGFTWGASLIRL